MATRSIDDAQPTGLTRRERLESYLALVGPMAMILALLLLMAILEPARYFRLSNFDIILKDVALYMPMAMAMTIVIATRGIDLSIGSVAALYPNPSAVYGGSKAAIRLMA
ncbi:MAG: hypothetical protein AAFY56_19720, partial [Pseudomonadota bacterium]